MPRNKSRGKRKPTRIRSASKRLRQVKQRHMAKQFSLFLSVLLVVLCGSVNRAPAQEAETKIRVEVNMVQLNVAVMDSKGNYVTGLRPSDFVVAEDGIPQKVATFGEGNEPTRRVTSDGTEGGKSGDLRIRQGSAGRRTNHRSWALNSVP